MIKIVVFRTFLYSVKSIWMKTYVFSSIIVDWGCPWITSELIPPQNM